MRLLMVSLGLVLALVLATTAPALAQSVSVEITPPQITFAAPPPLVEVEPGVQVVENHDDEVFVVDNVYYVRRHGHWFRSPRWDGGWVFVEPRLVPRPIFKLPPGRYRHWHGGPGPRGPHGPRGPRVVAAPGPRVVAPPPRRVAPPPRVRVVAPPRRHR